MDMCFAIAAAIGVVADLLLLGSDAPRRASTRLACAASSHEKDKGRGARTSDWQEGDLLGFQSEDIGQLHLGQSIAFYFTFLQHHSRFLTVPALLGFVLQVSYAMGPLGIAGCGGCGPTFLSESWQSNVVLHTECGCVWLCVLICGCVCVVCLFVCLFWNSYPHRS